MLKHMAIVLVLAASTAPAGAADPVMPANYSGQHPGDIDTGAQSRNLQHLLSNLGLTVFFRTNSLVVDEETRARIYLLGGLLREFPDLRVYLDAHSDRRGSNADNRRLSRARADAIANVFQEVGIPAERILGNAWGESYAEASTDDPDGLVFDRRVDIQLSLDPEA